MYDSIGVKRYQDKVFDKKEGYMTESVIYYVRQNIIGTNSSQLTSLAHNEECRGGAPA